MKYFIFYIFLLSCTAHARVFNIKEQDSGTYIQGNYGLSSVGSNAYTRASGTQTTFEDEPLFNWGGEVGFLFPHQDIAVRVGLAVVHPQKLNAKGNNSSGTELLSVESAIYGVYPVLNLDFYTLNSSWGRLFISAGGGYGKVVLSNKYTMTAAGTTLYGVSNYTEKASQYSYLLQTSVGYELYFTGSNTITFDIGYRYARAAELNYDKSATTINGPVEAGDPLVDPGEERREFNLGGAYAGIGLRFYFNF